LKKFIAFLSIFVVLSTALAGCGGNFTTATWSTSGTVVNNAEDESWELAIGRVNGHIRRDVTLSQDQLYMLHVRSNHSGGEITLTLTQGNTEIIAQIEDGHRGFLASTGLSPGTMRMRLDFDSATDVGIDISWRTGFFFQN